MVSVYQAPSFSIATQVVPYALVKSAVKKTCLKAPPLEIFAYIKVRGVRRIA